VPGSPSYEVLWLEKVKDNTHDSGLVLIIK